MKKRMLFWAVLLAVLPAAGYADNDSDAGAGLTTAAGRPADHGRRGFNDAFVGIMTIVKSEDYGLNCQPVGTTANGTYIVQAGKKKVTVNSGSGVVLQGRKKGKKIVVTAVQDGPGWSRKITLNISKIKPQSAVFREKIRVWSAINPDLGCRVTWKGTLLRGVG